MPESGIAPQVRRIDVLTDLLDGGLTSGQIMWRPYQDAVDVHWLFTAEDSGGAEAYIANQLPDSHTDEHEHPGFELVFVFEGEISDDRGRRYTPGSLLVNRPGSVHQMFSEAGCKVLVFRQHRVRPLSPRTA